MRLDKKTTINRLVIYFFYDADGIVDRYVPYMLKDIVKNCSELFVVCNGKLTPEGREILKTLTSHILVRENVGFDVWAYKEALEQYGWDRLEEFDEVVLMNHTIMGPVYPFSEMFEEMNQRDLDFWGINVYHKQMMNPYNISYGYIPEHLQSHFIAIRKNMLSSLEFHNYWDSRPEIASYEDSVGKHEAIFTKFFSDKGFIWDKYIDTDDLKDFTGYPLMWCPQRIIEEKRCPVFKRRSFFHPYEGYLEDSSGSQAKQLLDYFEKTSLYDTSMIWENILRTCHMNDIKNCTNLTWILPKDQCNAKVQSNLKVALIIHIYYEDLIKYCYNYALSMPKEADIYITSDSQDKCNKIESIFGAGPWHNVQIILIENRGRDVSALLVGAAKYVGHYDYICFAHDKKVTQLDSGIMGYHFSERCFENILGSREYVNNIICKFESEPFLGLLCPPPPNHGDYYNTAGCEWGYNYTITKKLYDDFDLSIPIAEYKEPIAPLGTMFWFRTSALKKLFAKKWEYNDFPKEPNGSDGTILHGFERIYPYIAQDAGYYTAWCMTDYYARTECTNLYFMLRNLNVRLFALYGVQKYNSLNWQISNQIYLNGENLKFKKITPARKKMKDFIKSITPKSVWAFLKKTYHSFGGKKWIG